MNPGQIYLVLITLPLVLSCELGTAQEDNQHFHIRDHCEARQAKTKCKAVFEDDYEYGGTQSTRIRFKHKKELHQLTIPVFKNENYIFVFNAEGLPQPIDIEIWDAKYQAKKRNLLFTSRNFPEEQKQYVYEITGVRNLHIDYWIPPARQELSSGCVVLVLGFQPVK